MTHNQEPDSDDQDTSTLLTLEQAAVQLQVSRKSLERYIKAGHLPGIRLSARTLRVSQSDLEEFIDRMREYRSR